MIPLIHETLHLRETEIGILTGLPVLLFAAAAVAGSALIARVGPRRAVAGGLVATAIAAAARGAGPTTAALLAATFLTGLAISVVQPALPSLVRSWAPRSIPTATASYTNGMLVGEVIAVAATGPIAARFGWETAIAVWSVPVLLTAAAVAARRDPVDLGREGASGWWPDWRDARMWQIGIVFGGGSLLYFGTNGFLPDYLRGAGRPDLVQPALTALNLAQVPASIAVALAPRLLIARRWPLVASGAVTVAAVSLLLVTSGPALVALTAVLGFVGGLLLVLTLALPPVLAGPGGVHRMSAGVFTVAYTCSALGPVIGGAAWDITHLRAAAFLPAVAGGLAMIVPALFLKLPSAAGGPRSRPG